VNNPTQGGGEDIGEKRREDIAEKGKGRHRGKEEGKT